MRDMPPEFFPIAQSPLEAAQLKYLLNNNILATGEVSCCSAEPGGSPTPGIGKDGHLANESQPERLLESLKG